ncbi:hypothetical protein Glove_9g255 [Diversispora epigaea]|uniref:Uncharacterized protein n=1 Tax=Diversispora epigaea TaxID=1348612 RepID=A0A397JRE5_9GLOM|nr:hypothetical protein Glove_9g255 [Diversispora epigaea]
MSSVHSEKLQVSSKKATERMIFDKRRYCQKMISSESTARVYNHYQRIIQFGPNMYLRSEIEHWLEIAKNLFNVCMTIKKIEANKAEIRQKKVIQHQRTTTSAIELVTTEITELSRKHVLDAGDDEKKNTEGATILAKKRKTESENRTKNCCTEL